MCRSVLGVDVCRAEMCATFNSVQTDKKGCHLGSMLRSKPCHGARSRGKYNGEAMSRGSLTNVQIERTGFTYHALREVMNSGKI